MKKLFYPIAVIFATGLVLIILLLAVAGYDPESSLDILLYFFWPVVFPTLLLGLTSSLLPLAFDDDEYKDVKKTVLLSRILFAALVLLIIALVVT